MKLKNNFLGGGGVQNKKPSMGGVWIFSGTAQSHFLTTSATMEKDRELVRAIEPYELQIGFAF